MRKAAFILLLILIAADIYPQPFTKYFWRQIPSPVSYNLNSFVYRFVAGDNGTLLTTTNNGYTFIKHDIFVNNNLNSIDLLFGNSVGTIVGDNGIIFYAVSSLWSQQNSGTTANLNGVSGWKIFYPENSFWRIAVGDNGTVIRSTNSSGFNWAGWYPVASPVSQKLNSVSMKGFKGWIVGDNGTLLKSTDRGVSWTLINSGVSNNLNCVLFSDTLNGWITGSNGLIMKTTNGGLNWIVKPSGTTVNLKSFLPYSAVGSNGTYRISTNMGDTWLTDNTGTQKSINSLYNIDPNNYAIGPVIVGDSGLILRRDIDSSYIFRKLEGNTIISYFCSRGIFNQDIQNTNSPGFLWPKWEYKNAIFTSGLSASAIVNGQLRQAMCSYWGEYQLGYCSNGIPHTNDTFKIYSVKRGDSHISNPDWMYWGLMVPYGAPYVDVNNNNQYEAMIDTPGVKNASQTIFMCLTDGFPSSHNIGEGFGGGTAPLFAETHITAWCYSQPSYNQMQFIKFDVINKGLNAWNRTHYSIVTDPDLGNSLDDYIGCDTARKLSYCYNYDNYDEVYGTAPPAVGFILLKGVYQKYTNPPKDLGLTAVYEIGRNSSSIQCETEANGEPHAAYIYMQGYKKDSTCWLDPTVIPYKKTKFLYPGDPETNAGWTEYKGRIQNCGGDTTGALVIYPGSERRINFSSGSDLNTVLPGDTQRIVICQLIARGNSNLNSVTKLKELADVAINFYNTGFVIGVEQTGGEIPSSFSLSQNYPNPFNSSTIIKFQMKQNGFAEIKLYDITGRLTRTPLKENLNAGKFETRFEAAELPSGIYFCSFYVNGNIIDTRKIVLIK